MKTQLITCLKITVMGCLGLTLTGCAAFRASTQDVDLSKDKEHFDSKYDYQDMRNITEDIVTQLESSQFLNDQSEPPIVMIAGVNNATDQYVDTKTLTDRMRTLLFKSGKMQFVNAARRDELLKEQGYQAAHATPETAVNVGQQLGAKYMLSGTLSEMKSTSPRQVRVSRQTINYYKLTMEVTDLQTGLLAWTTEVEFAREAKSAAYWMVIYGYGLMPFIFTSMPMGTTGPHRAAYCLHHPIYPDRP